MNKWIDTHSHVTFESFDADREEVLKRAAAAGLEWFFEVGIEPNDWSNVIQTVSLGNQNSDMPQSAAILGFHPHNAAQFSDSGMGDLKRTIEEQKEKGIPIIAVGEMGLDFFRDYAPRDAQFSAFRSQLKLAYELKLPIVIHCRAAEKEVFEELEKERDRRGELLSGIMHCFPSGAEDAKRTVELGLHLGIGGVVTYPKAEQLREAAVAAPKEKLVLETDCPFLTPQFKRGKRNEPAYVVETGKKLAEVLCMPVEDLAAQTTKNAKELFKLN